MGSFAGRSHAFRCRASWARRLLSSSGLLAVLVGCSGGGAATTTPAGDQVQAGDVYVDVYDAGKAYNGTTLFADTHDPQNARILEVDMQGKIVWSYTVPADLIQGTTVGPDTELLDNGHILFVLSGSGIYEIDRNGSIVWSYRDPNVSHDADRLSNGNTLFVFGNNDTKNDAQVKEVDPQGQTVWSWSARDVYDVEPYASVQRQGWTHTNAVTRMANGNTLVSLRNFNLTVEVNPQGEVVWSFDWTTLYEGAGELGFDPHEPELHDNNHLLVCLQWTTPYQITEIDRETKEVAWQYQRAGLRTARDSDRLPNGNTLIVGVLEDTEDSVIFEVTPAGEIVWQLRLKDTPADRSPGWFYKAQRIGAG